MFYEQTTHAIKSMGHSVEEISHAVGELGKAMGGYSHAEGVSLPYRQSAGIVDFIRASIVRKPGLKVDGIKNATLTINSEKIDWDVLEKRLWTI